MGSRADRAQIEEGLVLATSSIRDTSAGAYALQASIAAIHSSAARAADTDWQGIAELYAQLQMIRPSPVIELNRAVALAMADGPEAGLALIDRISASGELDDYHLLWSARADLLRRLERWSEAATSYEAALKLVRSAVERRFLERRLAAVSAKVSQA